MVDRDHFVARARCSSPRYDFISTIISECATLITANLYPTTHTRHYYLRVRDNNLTAKITEAFRTKFYSAVNFAPTWIYRLRAILRFSNYRRDAHGSFRWHIRIVEFYTPAKKCSSKPCSACMLLIKVRKIAYDLKRCTHPNYTRPCSA